MSTIFILIGVMLFLLAVISFFRPLPKLKLATKKAAGVALLLSLGSCIVGGALAPEIDGIAPSADLETSSAVETPAQAAPAEGVPIGTPIRNRDAQITVTSVEQRSQVGTQYLEERASQGGVLIVVKYDISNVGNEPLKFYSPKIELVDAAGVRYSSDIAKSAAYGTETDDNSKIFSDLNPGITTQGSSVFEVAADRFDPETWHIAVEGRKNKVRLK